MKKTLVITIILWETVKYVVKKIWQKIVNN